MRSALPIIATGLLLGICAPAGAATGGASTSVSGVIAGVDCALSCAGLSLAQTASVLRIGGTGLADVAQVTFIGAGGDADDVTASATAVTDTKVMVTVPAGTPSGRVRVINSDGTASAPSRQSIAVTTSPPPPSGAVHAKLSSTKVYFDGTKPATLSYFIDSALPSQVTITLVHGTHGAQVASWGPTFVAAGTVGQVTWAGTKTPDGGGVAATGRYTFQISVAGSGTRAVLGPQATSSFAFLPDVFPVAGKHSFSMGEGRFGAGRSGHTHQGQDIMAKCGVPLVAARGGVVEKVDVDPNAGNYVVIDAAGTGVDMFYAHLREPSPLKEGDPVLSGQPIGVVGRTGDATACHLHFEEWTAPGWYKGGHPFDPLPDLRVWEREARAAKK